MSRDTRTNHNKVGGERHPDKRKGKHRSKQLTVEQRREVQSANAKQQAGTYRPLPYGSVKALEAMKFRVKDEYKDNAAAGEIAGYAFERIVDVMGGRVYSRRAPSVLKAALAAREEICEPVVRENRITGTLGLASAVAAVQAKIAAKGAEAPMPAALPPAEQAHEAAATAVVETTVVEPPAPVVARGPVIRKKVSG